MPFGIEPKFDLHALETEKLCPTTCMKQPPAKSQKKVHVQYTSETPYRQDIRCNTANNSP